MLENEARELGRSLYLALSRFFSPTQSFLAPSIIEIAAATRLEREKKNQVTAYLLLIAPFPSEACSARPSWEP